MEILFIVGCVILTSLCAWLLAIKDAKEHEIEDLQKTLKVERSINESARQEWKRLNDNRNKQLHALQHNNSALLASKVRMSRIIRILRKREDPITLGLSWLVTPETDVNVCKVRVREQLAIELENMGFIKYKVSMFDEPKLGGGHILVKARINLLNLKYDAGTERSTEKDRE